MNKIIQYSFIACCIYLLHSCCTKKHCADGLFMIEFHNFNETEVDTLIVYTYSKDTQFTNLLNTQTVTSYTSVGVDYSSAYLDMVSKDYDYMVKVPGAGLVYHLTELSTVKGKCNTCFPFTPKSEYTHSLHHYKLNGAHCEEIPLIVNK